jgi:pimeloyl-ACP methyl ester carboxylesterase
MDGFFNLSGRRIAYQHWQAPGRPTFIAVHGWLDNSNSFQPLMDSLPEIDCFTLDLCGHGKSDHLPAHAHFYLGLDWALDVLAFARGMGLGEFILMGHSLGAGVCSLAASFVPAQVRGLILFDGLVPFPEPEDAFVRRARAFLDEAAGSRKPPLRYPDWETAVVRRMRASGLARVTAELLCRRSLVEQKGGFSWSWDERLLTGSPLRFSRGQLAEIAKSIASPALLIKASRQEIARNGELMEEFAPLVPGLGVAELEGGHYVHMENVPPSVDLVRDFLRSLPATPD